MDKFKKIAKDIKDKKLRLRVNESFLYGHIHALYSYAGVRKINKHSIPAIRHGLVIDQNRDSFNTDKLSHDFMLMLIGDINKKSLRKAMPNKLMFTLGPYIHYAEVFYSEDKLKHIKKDLGRCLLFFPTHTVPSGNTEYEKYENKVLTRALNILNEYKKDFDTILINVFWRDLDYPLYKQLEQQGYKIVSAGLHYDPNFLRRLKSYFQIADAVICDGIGTFIGYSIYMSKPVRVIESIISNNIYNATKYRENVDASYILKLERDFAKHFVSDCFKITDEQREYLEPYMGFKHVKTKDEVYAIIEIASYLLKKSKGSMKKYEENVIKIKELMTQNNYSEFTEMHRELLRIALL